MGNTIDNNTTYSRPPFPSGQPLGRPGSTSTTLPAPPRAADASASPGHVKFSDSVALLQIVQSKIDTTPAIDNQRVETSRTAIADGSYRIDHSQIASSLLALEKELP